MDTLYVKIDGIVCDNCRVNIRNKLLGLKTVKDVEIIKNIAKITYLNEIDKLDIINVVNNLGYFTKDDYMDNDIKNVDSNISPQYFILIVVSILLIFFLLEKLFGYNIFNVIPTIDENISYGMLFITGLLTSIHCISMCGAINLMTAFNDENNFKRPILYNLGRLISYSFLGGIIGLVGSVISINEIINGTIIIFASILMFLMSLSMLNIIKLPSLMLKNKFKTNNSFIIGLLNGFMPCGPLQAMQVYALSTGSFFKGAFSMFLFCLGTVPLMLGVGIIFNVIKKRKIILNKIASILILLLSLAMFLRGLSALGISYNFNYKNYKVSTIYKDYQEVKIDLSYGGYDDIIVQKGIKVRLIINVSKKYLTGCNNVVMINDFNIKKKLKVGENIIEFMPDKVGVYSMNCWMNMITNNIKVIDDEKYFEVENE